MSATVFQEITEARLMPQLVRLGANLYGAVFSLMKLVPARYILRRAAQRGQLRPDTVIAETTSGTFGLALAMQAALTGHRLVLVSDPATDANLRRRLTDLGAEVVICERPAEVGGYQEARLARLRSFLSEHPDSFCPQQYSNPDNPAAYVDVAEHLWSALGSVDCVVGPVGSGGSMCGTVRALRTVAPAVYAIGVDTYRSVLFGQPDGPRAVRGLGNSLLPANLDHQVFDEVHWGHAAEVFAATRTLHRRHSLFQGPTSGAAYQVARWWAERNPDGRCVVLLADEGYRYQETVYDDDWLAANGFALAQPPAEPVRLDHPAQVAAHWGWYPWRRRRYADVVGPPR
jgi:cysteine synthase A